MNGKQQQPKTLQDAIVFYSNPDNALAYMVRLRWPDGIVTCPKCGRKDPVFLQNQRKWQCKSIHKKRQFSAKVGSIFEDSPIALEKWLTAVWMLSNCKNGVSSYEIARTLGVTQKTAWFMMHRIRLGMRDRNFGSKLGGTDGGPVEVDETFVGGKAKNQHKSRRLELVKVRNGISDNTDAYPGKTAVQGFLDRDARKVRATVVPNVKRETLQEGILKNVKYGSKLYSDAAIAYDGMNWKYVHEVVNKLEGYVRGQVHTNGLENFWSLLKRGLHGTYVAVEPFHLFRYVDEQVFRFNNRGTRDNKISDAERFDLAMSQIMGRRLTYSELTGKDGATLF